MTAKQNGDSSAYPTQGRCAWCDGTGSVNLNACEYCGGLGQTHEGGMTKREKIAAITLGGAMANRVEPIGGLGNTHRHIARDALLCTDSLLAELAKEKP